MRTIETKVYALSELSPNAREKAREWHRSSGLWDGDCTIEDAKQCLAIAGFEIENVYYSGFSSQGDGACFEGRWHASDAKGEAAMKAHAPKDARLHYIAQECARIASLYPQASMSVKQRGHYNHEHCTDFTVNVSDDDSPEAGDASEALEEVSKDAMRWIYRQLESDYNWHNADEQVDESIEANRYTFTEDGKRFW